MWIKFQCKIITTLSGISNMAPTLFCYTFVIQSTVLVRKGPLTQPGFFPNRNIARNVSNKHPEMRLLLFHHVLELVQAENAIAIRVVLGEDFLSWVLFVTCSLLLLRILFLPLILLALFENEVVQSQELVVELTDDLKAPEMIEENYAPETHPRCCQIPPYLVTSLNWCLAQLPGVA